MNLTIGKQIKLIEVIAFDHSVLLSAGGSTISISRDVAKNILVTI